MLVIILLMLIFCFVACQDKIGTPAKVNNVEPQQSIITEKPNSFYKNAYTWEDCAPWDGPAVSFYLTDKEAEKGEIKKPYLSISIYRSISQISIQPFIVGFGGGVNVGIASLCPDQGDCKLVKSGIVVIKKVVPSQSIEGDYQLEFEDGIKKTGSFQASWIKRRVLCG